VQVDTGTGRPTKLGEDFHQIYGSSAGGRIVSSKLSLPARPSETAMREPWEFRRADLDQFGHVNNAAHWAVMEEVLQRGGVPRTGVGELEYVAAADADDPSEVMTDHDMVWVVAHGRTLTAARWTALD